MVQKRISARDNAVHRVFLVRAQFDSRVHLGEFQITAVVFRQSDLVEQSVVDRFQLVAPNGTCKYPILERFLDFVLFLSRRYRFRLIEYALFSAVLV